MRQRVHAVVSSIAHRIAALPALVWEPLASGVVILIAGWLSMLFGQLWLFPSLASTALLQAHDPLATASRLRPTIVGHFCGIAAGYLFMIVFGINQLPRVAAWQALDSAHLLASVCAVALTLALQLLLCSFVSAGASTAMLIGFGLFRLQWREALGLVVGVVIVAICGELLRRLRRPLQARPERADASAGQGEWPG